MKRFSIVMLSFVLASGSLFAQDTSVEQMHLSLLKLSFPSSLESNEPNLREMDGKTFSILHQEREASVYVASQTSHYLLYSDRTETRGGFVLNSKIYIFSQETLESQAVISATIEKSPTGFHFSIDPSALEQGYTSGCFAAVASAYMEDALVEGLWWEGMLAFDPAYVESRAYYKTKEQAIANVPHHVQPKSCFIWRDGKSSTPWRPIPGTGCAHWIAHQKGIYSSPGCFNRCAIRVSQVVSGKSRHSINNARVGDIWTNTSLSHCGIVIGVGSGTVRVRHCSSGSGGVVVGNFRSGYSYR